jgi:hypothetical protein
MKFRPIIPVKINVKALMSEVTGEMKDIHKEVSTDFDATVRTWDNKPKFAKEFEQSDRRVRFFTGTDDAVYGYVSGGTRPHIIRPKRRRVLHFQGTYTAKTSPGTIEAKSGGSSGADVFSRGVRHPGTKPRNFPKSILKKWEGPFAKRMTQAMGRAAKKSGHGI